MSKEMVVSASSHDTKVAILEDGQVVEVYFEREKQYSLAGSIYKGRVTRILPGMQSAFVNIGLERDAFLYVSDFLEQVEEYDRVATTGEERENRRPREGARETREMVAPPPAAAESPAAVESAPATPERADLSDAERPRAERPERPERSARPERPGQAAQPPQSSRPPRSEEQGEDRDKGQRFSRRGRRHRGRQRGIPDSKFARPSGPPAGTPEPPAAVPAESRPEPRRADSREETRQVSHEAPPERILLPGESIAKYRGLPTLTPGSVDAPDTPIAPPQPEPRYSQPDAPAAATTEIAEPATADAQVLSDIVIAPAAPEAPYEALPEPILPEEYQPEAVYGIQHPGIGTLTILGVESEPEMNQDRFLTVEEAVGAVREERMIEDLEEEAAEIVESEQKRAEAPESGAAMEEAPSWEALEEHVHEMIERAEPDSPEAGAQDPTAASAVGESSQETAAARQPSDSEQAEGPRQAAVRERSGNPRFQRRGRWQARRPQRGPDRGPDRGQERSPDRGGEGGQRRPPRSPEREAPKPLIGDMLKEGQEIIVQVAKEPLGKKGARITSHIALPGRYIVYMPTLDHVGVSRKIASDEERHRLKRLIVEHTKNLSGGFIVRTAGEGATDEDLRQDVQFLVKLWAEVKEKAEKATAPSLLHHDLDLTLRTLRDQLSDDFQTIWVDNEQVYEQIVSLVQKFQPTLINRVRLYSKDVPLFEETGVQEEINKALKPKVWLKSGGYIVINQTEALVAIDVNTGKFVGKSNRLEDTIVKTNVEAIQEIVRQIRLRDLGGIIVIDFIDMDERRNRQRVMTTLEDAMRADKAPSKILSFNEFGLLAITRKRVRQSLERTLCQPCAYCSGAGLVKSPATVILEVLAEARKIASDLAGKQVTLRVNPEVGKALKAPDNDVLAALEELTGRGVIIRNDAAVHIENFYFD